VVARKKRRERRPNGQFVVLERAEIRWVPFLVHSLAMNVLFVLVHIPGRWQRGGETFPPFDTQIHTRFRYGRAGQGNANRPRSAHAYARLDGTMMMWVGRQDKGGGGGGFGWMDARCSVGQSVAIEERE
jgi:hypothetical protein